MPVLAAARLGATALLGFAVLLGTSAGAQSVPSSSFKRGNVIFIHPDGTGVNTWGAARMRWVGPDGMLNWDKMPHVGVYRGHLSNALAASSNGGGTVHAYGVKVSTAAMGRDQGRQVISASGKPYGLMVEAKRAGLSVGVINSASVVDAGTGVFLASVPRRRDTEEIASQMLANRPEVILGGGETFFLPKGKRGRHGEGMRTDGRDLIAEARKAGYSVVFTREELAALPAGTKRVLGLFAQEDTFHDESEEALAKSGKPLYVATAPTIAEMTAAALRVFRANGKRFFLVAEEEGTDNFAGAQNASGVFVALRRADEALGVAMRFADQRKDTLVLTAADSDCGGMQVVGETVEDLPPTKPGPKADGETGSAYDGVGGTGTRPFLAPPNRDGVRLPFMIAWAGGGDMSGGIVARAAGLNAARLPATVDNTALFKLMRGTLFGGS